MPQRQPPRFVPTLTEVVQGGRASGTIDPAAHEQLVQRIMQRIDLTPDRQVREAIASVVLERNRQLAPALREQIEAVVATAVSEAIAEELDPPRSVAGQH